MKRLLWFFKNCDVLFTSIRPLTSIVIEFGVRCLNTKPKLRAAETNADSSGLWAWYSNLESFWWTNGWQLKCFNYFFVSNGVVVGGKFSQILTYRPSLYSGITVWHNASKRKKLCACSSSDSTASSSVWSNHLKSGS